MEPYDRRARHVSEQTGVSIRTAVRLIDAGEIPAKKIGKSVCLRQSDIDAYIARSDRPAPTAPRPEPSTTAPRSRRRGRPRVEA